MISAYSGKLTETGKSDEQTIQFTKRRDIRKNIPTLAPALCFIPLDLEVVASHLTMWSGYQQGKVAAKKKHVYFIYSYKNKIYKKI